MHSQELEIVYYARSIYHSVASQFHREQHPITTSPIRHSMAISADINLDALQYDLWVLLPMRF